MRRAPRRQPMKLYEAQRMYLEGRTFGRPHKSGEQKRRMAHEQGWKCPLCDGYLSFADKLSIDHIRPLSKGGSNDQRNLQLVHEACNQAKGDKWDGMSGHPPGWGLKQRGPKA